MTAPRMTDAEIETFAAAHLAAHPDDTAREVFAAIRGSGYTGYLQDFQVHDACQKARPIPTLATAAEVVAVMDRLAARYAKTVSVFWDRGWGDSGEVAEISVIIDGNGQMPLARLTPEVYDELRSSETIQPNCLHTFKARRLHDYWSPADVSAGVLGGDQ